MDMFPNGYDPFAFLGVDRQQADRKAIKRAYAKKLKTIDPEKELTEFQRLREAYEAAMELVDFADTEVAPEGQPPKVDQDLEITYSLEYGNRAGWFEQGFSDSNPADAWDGLDESQLEEIESLLQQIRDLTEVEARSFSWKEILDHYLLENPLVKKRVEYEIYNLLMQFASTGSDGNLVLPGFVGAELIRLLDSKFGWLNEYRFGLYESGIIDNAFWISLNARFEKRGGYARAIPSDNWSISVRVYPAIVVIFLLIIKFLYQGISDGMEESKNREIRNTIHSMLQELEKDLVQIDPETPKSVVIGKAVLRYAEQQADSAPTEFNKKDAAILQFIGFYFFNTRTRFAHCKDLGVEIGVFAREFRKAHQPEMAIVLPTQRVIFAGENKYYSISRIASKFAAQEMDDIGSRLGLDQQDTCRYIDENGALFVDENLLLSRIFPDVYQAIHEPE